MYKYISMLEAKEFYVYRLKTHNDEVFYIGKGSGDRMFRHFQIAKGKSISRSKNLKLYNKISSIIKNGGFVIPEVLFRSQSEEECHLKEIELIQEIGLENLCNLTLGGEGTSGYKLSDETKTKMSEAKKKYWDELNLNEIQVAERREKILTNQNIHLFREGHEGYFKNKKLSDETKTKMSEAKKGKPSGPISEKRRLAIIEGIKKKKGTR